MKILAILLWSRIRPLMAYWLCTAKCSGCTVIWPLIHDGGPSHIAALTSDYFDERPGWWHPRLTPAQASWLNQGELLNHAFDGRYLKRGSWPSRGEYIDHVASSWPEYNRLYAHPFEWTWTNQKMRRWFEEHAP